MLRLENTQNSGISYPLLIGKVYVVGRKQGDITFQDDQSISRAHAELEVEHSPGNLNDPLLVPMLKVTDSGSKFGTFALEESIENKLQMSARDSITLPIGEKLRFGLQWNEFKVVYTPLVVTTSSFKPTPDFKDKIRKLGGHVLSEWSSYVTHVVMDSVSLTVKVVCALLAAKPIVTPVYITDLLSSIESKQTIPLDVTRYLPPVTEKGIAELKSTSFFPNTARTTLFGGKIFLFCTNRHLKKLSAAIEAGGGTAQLITDNDGGDVLSRIAHKSYVIMAQPQEIQAGEKHSQIKYILDAYKRAGKRVIGDSEIGLAAVHNSLEKFCNPTFDMANAVLPSLTTQTQSSIAGSSFTLVGATQGQETQRSSVGNDARNIINETVVDDDEGEVERQGTRSVCGSKRQIVQDGNSSAKKRGATEPLLKPPSKRLKDTVQDNSKSLLSSSSSSKALPGITTDSARALSKVFNMSDSDDDSDDLNSRDKSETQPNIEVEPDVIPASQPQDDEEMVNVVNVRNLQSIRGTQDSVSSKAAARLQEISDDEDDSDVERVLESPPLVSIGASETATIRVTRNRGTGAAKSISTALQNAETVPVSTKINNSLGTKKSGLASSSSSEKLSEGGTSSTRKRQREEDQDDSNAILEKTKKITLNDVKEETTRMDEKNSVLIKRSLVNKNPTRCRIPEGSDDGQRKNNFKTFQKVLPKFVTKDGRDQENLSGRARVNILNTSIESNRSNIRINLVRRDYFPGASRASYGLGENNVSALNPRARTNAAVAEHEILHSPEKRKLDIMDVRPSGSRGLKETTDSGEPVAVISTRNRLRNTATSLPSSSNRSNSPQRRTSPRKKGSSSATLMPPPPPPQPQYVPMEEDEEEDDEWTFKR